MPGCCAYGFRSRTMDGRKFFSISRGDHNVSRRKIWLHRIGRKDFVPPENTQLCEVSDFAVFINVNTVVGFSQPISLAGAPLFLHMLLLGHYLNNAVIVSAFLMEQVFTLYLFTFNITYFSH